MTYLRENNWFDNRTKAIFFEFGSYNPFLNLFAVCARAHTRLGDLQVTEMVLESPHIGVFEPFMRFDPINLYRYNGPMGMVTLVCEVIFIFYLIVFLIQAVSV
jgi:hypothetical protein